MLSEGSLQRIIVNGEKPTQPHIQARALREPKVDLTDGNRRARRSST